LTRLVVGIYFVFMCDFQKIQIAVWVLNAITAILVFFVAWQQWQTNDKKLRLDLYDRKLKIYEEVNKIIAKMLNQMPPYQYDDIVNFKQKTSEA
jgi:hypothetical protein